MDRVKVYSNERLDISDVEAIIDGANEDAKRQNQAFISASAQILNGFFFTIVDADTLRVTLGAAYTPDNLAAGGQLLTNGASQQTLEFGGLTTSTVYTVWIRLTTTDGTTANRVFWDAAAVDEVVSAVDTRQIESWEAQVAETSPGVEWVPCWQVNWNSDLTAGAPNNLITDVRPLLFEGAGGGSDYDNGAHVVDDANDYVSTWGGGNDRSSDRGTYAIGDFATFAQMVLQKLDEIQGGVNDTTNTNPQTGRWWDAPTHSLDDVLPLTGNNGTTGGMRGGIYPATDGTYNDGTNALRWANGYFDKVWATDEVEIQSTSPYLNLDCGSGGVALLEMGDTDFLNFFSIRYTESTQLTNIEHVGELRFVSDAQGTVMSWDGTPSTGVAFHVTPVPSANLGENMGSSSYRWNDGFFDAIDLNEAPTATTARLKKLDAVNVPKAWGHVTTDGVGGVTLDDGYNITSVAVGVGGVTITFAQAFANTNFALVVTGAESTLLHLYMEVDGGATRTTTTCLVAAILTSTLANFDLSANIGRFSFVVFGRQ
jgi:hypothetical protein